MEKNSPSEDWIDIAGAAEYLKVSVDTIRSWIKKDATFPAYKIGRLWRLRKTDLDNWVKNGATDERN